MVDPPEADQPRCMAYAMARVRVVWSLRMRAFAWKSSPPPQSVHAGAGSAALHEGPPRTSTRETGGS
jgi:hypothetical protein